MAGKNQAKVTFLAETKAFRDNVKQAASTITELTSELRLNAAQMKTNGTSVEGLTERQKLLESQLEQAKTKTQNLAAQMESCAKNYGANSTEVQKLSVQINNARIAEEKIQQEINRTNQELAEQAQESKDAGNAFDKLAGTISQQEGELSSLKSKYAAVALELGTNSKEARELATKISSLSSELNDNRAEMSRVETAANNVAGELDEAGDAAKEAGDGFTVLKGTLADLASAGIQNILSGIGELASAFWNLGDETRELRTNLGKVEVAFADAGFSAETASATYNNFYAVLGDEGQATEAVNHLAKLADTQKELDEWTRICTGVYATFGDSLPIENLAEASNETAKVGKVTGGLADALNWSTMSSKEWTKAFNGHPRALGEFQKALKEGLSVEDAFNEALTQCTTESEREQVIRQALTGIYGDAADAYEETNGQIIEANRAQSEYNNALAGLGEVIEPIKTVFMEGMAGMLEAATALFEGLDMEAIKSNIQGAFDYLNETVFPIIKEAIQWFIDNKDLVIAGLTGIVTAIAAFKVVTIVQTAVSAFKAFQAATTGLTLAQKALNLVMMANPIALVVAAIAGLVAAFVLLWNKCEGFRNFWINLWENIKSACSVAWEAIKGFFSGAWEAIKGIWSGVTAWFSGVWKGIQNAFSSVGAWFSKLFTSAWNGIKNAWNGVKNWFSNLWTGIKNVFSSVGTWFKNTFTSAWNGIKNAWSSVKSWFSNLWNGIKGVFSSVASTFKGWFTSAWNNVKSAFSKFTSFFSDLWDDIVSGFKELPEKIKNIGSDIVEGLWNGINNMVSWLGEKISGFCSNALGAIKRFFGIESPSRVMRDEVGKFISQGIGVGIADNADSAISPMYDIVDEISSINPVNEWNKIASPKAALNYDVSAQLGDYVANAVNSNSPYGALSELINAVEDMANRAINLNIDSVRIAQATAGANDSVSGNRLNLKERGLALA